MCNPNTLPDIYQLLIVLRDVSPIIWRRILVTDDTSIADLHAILQIILEWSDDHLNQFIIRGKSYGVYHNGGLSFADDPKRVYLKDFQFRPNETFRYEYNFNDGWEFDIRLEKTHAFNSKLNYPHCLGGGRLAPPEDCGGPLAFLKLDHHYSVGQMNYELIRYIYRLAKAQGFEHLEDLAIDSLDDEDDYDDDYDLEVKLETLRYWANRHTFNRNKVNELLQIQFRLTEIKRGESA